MSVEEKNSYIKNLEYDLDLDPEEIEAEIYANIGEDRDPEWLQDWADALYERSIKMCKLCEIYEKAANQADALI